MDISPPPQGPGPGDGALEALPRDLVVDIVDRLSPVDAACLALTCRSLREAVVLAPATTRLRVTPRSAAWLRAPGRLAFVTDLWLDLGPIAAVNAADGPAAAIGAALVAGAAPLLRSLTLSVTADYLSDELPGLALDAYLGPQCALLRHVGVHGAAPDAGRAAAAFAALDSLALDTVRTTPLVRPMLTNARVRGLELATAAPKLRSLALRTAPTQVVNGGAAFVAWLKLPTTLTRLEWDRGAWATAESEPSPAALATALPALRSLRVVAASHHSKFIVRDPPPRGMGPLDLDLAAQASYLMVDALLPWAHTLVALDLTLGSGTELDMAPLAAAQHLTSLTLHDARRVSGLPPTLKTLALHGNRRRSRDPVRIAWPSGGLPLLERLEIAVGEARVELWSADDAAPLDAAASTAAGASLRLESYVCVASGVSAREGWPDWLAAALERARVRPALNALVLNPTPDALASPHSSPADGVDWPVRVCASGMGGVRDALACAATGVPTHLRVSLFGRRPGDRGIQAAVAALGPIPLSPDEMAAL